MPSSSSTVFPPHHQTRVSSSAVENDFVGLVHHLDFARCDSSTKKDLLIKNKSVGKIVAFLLFIFFLSGKVQACQCPSTQLSLDECNKYEIIFKGKILKVTECGHKFGEAIFEIEELYKGNSTKEFKVLFDCNVECVQKFNVGDEWVIYSRYKQIDNAMMDWCSRSRKYFKVEKEDFYTINYGNDYYDEVKFLQEKLGNHRLLVDNKSQMDSRNVRPNTSQLIIIIICSVIALVLFYYLFNKFFR